MISVASRCIPGLCYNGGTCYEHSPASTIFAYCLCRLVFRFGIFLLDYCSFRPGFAGSRCEIGKIS
jgi:hypothetical protein